jgi:hypothetical protein
VSKGVAVEKAFLNPHWPVKGAPKEEKGRASWSDWSENHSQSILNNWVAPELKQGHGIEGADG